MVDLSRVRRGGVLGPFADGFAEALTAAGYTPHGARKQLHLLAHLSRWLDSEGLEPAGLDGQAIGRFFAERRAAGYSKQVSVRASEPLMGYCAVCASCRRQGRRGVTGRWVNSSLVTGGIWCSSGAVAGVGPRSRGQRPTVP